MADDEERTPPPRPVAAQLSHAALLRRRTLQRAGRGQHRPPRHPRRLRGDPCWEPRLTRSPEVVPPRSSSAALSAVRQHFRVRGHPCGRTSMEERGLLLLQLSRAWSSRPRRSTAWWLSSTRASPWRRRNSASAEKSKLPC